MIAEPSAELRVAVRLRAKPEFAEAAKQASRRGAAMVDLAAAPLRDAMDWDPEFVAPLFDEEAEVPEAAKEYLLRGVLNPKDLSYFESQVDTNPDVIGYQSDPELALAQSVCFSSDPLGDTQRVIQLISQPLQAAGCTGNGSRVAIVDSGVDRLAEKTRITGRV